MNTINQKINEGIFDVMLTVACGEIADKQVAEWDAANTGEHSFSPEFERKMDQLMRGHNRKIKTKKAKKALSRAAIVIVAIMTIGFTITMSVQSLRVQFFNAVREFAEEYIGFSFKDNDRLPADGILRPAYVPDGYSEEDIQTTLIGTRIMYRHENGDRIIFKQDNMHEGSDIRVDRENLKDQYTMIVKGVAVQVYEGKDTEYDNYVIWGEEGTLYQLSGTIHSAELIEMAKSIIK